MDVPDTVHDVRVYVQQVSLLIAPYGNINWQFLDQEFQDTARSPCEHACVRVLSSKLKITKELNEFLCFTEVIHILE